MAWWHKFLPGNVISGENPDEPGSPERDDPLYNAVWERKELPDPGAMVYAWETLGLVQFSPIGPAVATRTPYKPSPGQREGVSQLYWYQSVPLQGIGTVQGQLIHAPLLDPNQPESFGYTTDTMVYLPPQLQLNLPVWNAQPLPTNVVDPARYPNNRVS